MNIKLALNGHIELNSIDLDATEDVNRTRENLNTRKTELKITRNNQKEKMIYLDVVVKKSSCYFDDALRKLGIMTFFTFMRRYIFIVTKYYTNGSVEYFPLLIQDTIFF